MNRIVAAGWLLLALAFAAAFAGLGFWQWGRALEKQQYLDGWTIALQAAPRTLAQALGAEPSDVPQRVTGRVRLRERPLLLLDNQQREGRVGVRAYAVAQADGDAPAVLLELGWRPLGADRQPPMFEVPSELPALVGVLQRWPGQGLRLGETPWRDDVAQVVLTVLDRHEISEKLDLPLYDGVLVPDIGIELGAVRDPGTLPNTLSPDHHRGYAVQWWALSFSVLVLYTLLALRRKPR